MVWVAANFHPPEPIKLKHSQPGNPKISWPPHLTSYVNLINFWWPQCLLFVKRWQSNVPACVLQREHAKLYEEKFVLAPGTQKTEFSSTFGFVFLTLRTFKSGFEVHEPHRVILVLPHSMLIITCKLYHMPCFSSSTTWKETKLVKRGQPPLTPRLAEREQTGKVAYVLPCRLSISHPLSTLVSRQILERSIIVLQHHLHEKFSFIVPGQIVHLPTPVRTVCPLGRCCIKRPLTIRTPLFCPLYVVSSLSKA